MATAVYVLCALTSLACALLLAVGWRRTGARLLLWSTACFVLLAANNVLLFLDNTILADTDLSVARAATGFAGLTTLLVGLIWERS